MNEFKEQIEERITEQDNEIIAETFATIHGYKFRCIKSIVKKKNSWPVEERWFCLTEGEGKGLPHYIREGAHKTGYKTWNNFFAMLGYYKMPVK